VTETCRNPVGAITKSELHIKFTSEVHSVENLSWTKELTYKGRQLSTKSVTTEPFYIFAYLGCVANNYWVLERMSPFI
jgi:hypothetical protein